jgi:hypothetical protein
MTFCQPAALVKIVKNVLTLCRLALSSTHLPDPRYVVYDEDDGDDDDDDDVTPYNCTKNNHAA